MNMEKLVTMVVLLQTTQIRIKGESLYLGCIAAITKKKTWWKLCKVVANFVSLLLLILQFWLAEVLVSVSWSMVEYLFYMTGRGLLVSWKSNILLNCEAILYCVSLVICFTWQENDEDDSEDDDQEDEDDEEDDDNDDDNGNWKHTL